MGAYYIATTRRDPRQVKYYPVKQHFFASETTFIFLYIYGFVQVIDINDCEQVRLVYFELFGYSYKQMLKLDRSYLQLYLPTVILLNFRKITTIFISGN